MFNFNNQIRCLAASLLLLLAGCHHNSTTTTTLVGDYVQQSFLDGPARSNAAVFSLNGFGYISTGLSAKEKLSDLWQFDPNLNSWSQKAKFPGTERYEAAGFATNGKGYVGLGWDGIGNFYKDIYSYDPASNQWTKVATFPGSGRWGSVSFGYTHSQLGAGYIGTGNDGSNELKDFWKFSPMEGDSGVWSQAISIPGQKRVEAVAFTIDSIAYVGMGSNNGIYVNDFSAFNLQTGTWTEDPNLFPTVDIDKNGVADRDLRRAGATAFTVKKKGYVTTGNYSSYTFSTWEFDPATSGWTQKSNFEGAGRTDGAGFSINDRGFILTGKNGASKYDDVWEFLPDATQQ